ncbi:hypothetical protein Tco_0510853 [Tanacetum coccineum]
MYSLRDRDCPRWIPNTEKAVSTKTGVLRIYQRTMFNGVFTCSLVLELEFDVLNEGSMEVDCTSVVVEVSKVCCNLEHEVLLDKCEEINENFRCFVFGPQEVSPDDVALPIKHYWDWELLSLAEKMDYKYAATVENTVRRSFPSKSRIITGDFAKQLLNPHHRN